MPPQDDAVEASTDPARAKRIFLRPLGSPLPLGFLGLGGGTIALAGLQLGWVPTAEWHQVGIAVLLVAVPLQVVASLLGYLSRDPVAATGMGTLAATWALIGTTTLLGAPGTRSPLLGLMLFYLSGAVLISALIAAAGKILAAIVLGLATARFATTGVYEYLGGIAVKHAAGWVGLALCVVAVYAALAFELEGMRHTTILPTLRHGAGRSALSDSGMATTGAAHREPGVREQL